MIRSGWLATRALLAIVLMLGFYLLAIGMALGLFYIPYAEWTYGGRLDLRIAIFCIVAGILILSSIGSPEVPFVAPGPRLDAKDQPRLFARLAKLSNSLRQRMPEEVYLVADVNAWVTQVERKSGFGKKRVMGIGLPLLQVVTISQFEAVLAHEFGHYSGGDTTLGPWIYKTRLAIGQTVQRLSAAADQSRLMSLVRVPFLWYGKMFLRITQAISRAQELSADRLAAETIGADALAGGLRSIHRAAVAGSFYLNSEALPVVKSGFAPPLTEGFASFLQTESISKSMEEHLDAQLSSSRMDPYDTHPPLMQRIDALKNLPKAKLMDDASALCLLDNLPQVELQLMASWLAEDAKPLRPIEWPATGLAVWLPEWERTSALGAKALAGLTLDQFYKVASKPDDFARKLDVWRPGIPWDAVMQYASNILGSSFACALYSLGWRIESAPGVLWMVQGANRLNPFQVIGQIASGELNESAWNERIASYDLARSMSLEPRKTEFDDAASPLRSMRVCKACGVPYNPADYRPNVAKRFCTNCGVEL